MKNIILSTAVLFVLLNCNCFIFSSYQSAKMLGKGEKTLTPSAGAAVATNFKRQGTIITPVGISIGIGKSEKVNFLITEGLYGTFRKDDEGVPVNSGFNYGGFEVKLGLRKHKTALSNYICYHIGTGEYNLALQIGTKLIQSFYLSSGADITVTPHFGYIFSGYYGPFLGTHVSTGIPVNDKITFRPEIGIANLDFSEDWNLNAGIGFTVSL